MVAETDDREERTEEPGEALSSDSALIGWLGAIHSEMRETRRELSERIDRVERRSEERDNRLEERMARIEGGMEAERERKNRAIARLSIVVGALIGIGGIIVGVIGLLN